MEVQGQLQVVRGEVGGKEREQHLLSVSSPPDVRPALRCPSSRGHCCRCCFRLLDFLFALCSSGLDSHQMQHPSLSPQTHSWSRPCVHLLRKRLGAATEEEGTGCRERWLKRNRDLEPCGSGS